MSDLLGELAAIDPVFCTDWPDRLDILNAPDERYRDYPIVGACVQPVYRLDRHRHGWHGRHSINYYEDGLSFSRGKLERAANDDKRKQGNSFCIEELPALCLIGPRRSVVAIDMKPGSPTDPFARMFRHPLFARELVRRWSTSDRVICLDFRYPLVGEGISGDQLRSWRSKLPHARRDPLAWVPEGRKQPFNNRAMAESAARVSASVPRTLAWWKACRKAHDDVNRWPSDMGGLPAKGDYCLTVTWHNEHATVQVDHDDWDLIHSLAKELNWGWCADNGLEGNDAH